MIRENNNINKLNWRRYILVGNDETLTKYINQYPIPNNTLRFAASIERLEENYNDKNSCPDFLRGIDFQNTDIIIVNGSIELYKYISVCLAPFSKINDNQNTMKYRIYMVYV